VVRTIKLRMVNVSNAKKMKFLIKILNNVKR